MSWAQIQSLIQQHVKRKLGHEILVDLGWAGGNFYVFEDFWVWPYSIKFENSHFYRFAQLYVSHSDVKSLVRNLLFKAVRDPYIGGFLTC